MIAVSDTLFNSLSSGAESTAKSMGISNPNTVAKQFA